MSPMILLIVESLQKCPKMLQSKINTPRHKLKSLEHQKIAPTMGSPQTLLLLLLLKEKVPRQLRKAPPTTCNQRYPLPTLLLLMKPAPKMINKVPFRPERKVSLPPTKNLSLP